MAARGGGKDKPIMLRLIELLRQKPKPVRALYAFWCAAIFTFFVAALWSLSLPNRIVSVLESATVGETTAQPTGRFFASARESFANLFATDFFNEETVPVTSTPPGVYEIDLATLTASTSDSVATSSANRFTPTTTTTTLERTGRMVLIGTTTVATSSASSDTVVQ